MSLKLEKKQSKLLSVIFAVVFITVVMAIFFISHTVQ